MKRDGPLGGERRLTDGEIADRKPQFIRLGSIPVYEGYETTAPPTLPDGDDGIRTGDEIRAELDELLASLDT